MYSWAVYFLILFLDNAQVKIRISRQRPCVIFEKISGFREFFLKLFMAAVYFCSLNYELGIYKRLSYSEQMSEEITNVNAILIVDYKTSTYGFL